MPTPDAWHDGWGDSPQDTWTDAWGNRHLYDPDRDSDWGQDEPPDPLTEEQNRRLEQEQLAIEESEKRMRENSAAWGPRKGASKGQLTMLDHLRGGNEKLEGAEKRGSYQKTYPWTKQQRKVKRKFSTHTHKIKWQGK